MVCVAVQLASSPPPIPIFFLPLFRQCDGCLEWGPMAGLWGFASHGGSFLSRGWLATVDTLGIPGTHLPLKRGSWLTLDNE